MPSYTLLPNTGLVPDLAVHGGALGDEMLRWLYALGFLHPVLMIGIVGCVILLPTSRRSAIRFRVSALRFARPGEGPCLAKPRAGHPLSKGGKGRIPDRVGSP